METLYILQFPGYAYLLASLGTSSNEYRSKTILLDEIIYSIIHTYGCVILYVNTAPGDIFYLLLDYSTRQSKFRQSHREHTTTDRKRLKNSYPVAHLSQRSE